MDIIDQIKETAATANACYVAGMKATEDSMGDRLIAAGARAAESERKLRRLLVALDETPTQGWRYCDCPQCKELRAAIEEALKP